MATSPSCSSATRPSPATTPPSSRPPSTTSWPRRSTCRSAAGAIGFGAGAALARTGATVTRQVVVSGVTEGAVGSGGGYLAGPGPHTPGGLLRTTVMGGATGAVPFPGGAADNVASAAVRRLDDVAPVPSPPRPDFVVGGNGVAIPTSRSRLEGG